MIKLKYRNTQKAKNVDCYYLKINLLLSKYKAHV